MTRSLHTLIHYLRHCIPGGDNAALTDAQLLERWIRQRDPAAFELLLWRHGPMVLNTCRRLLPRREDAEDAFQATFLVFVRKAGSIRRPEALAAWLHRTACRIAVRARATDIRRARREKPLGDAAATAPIDAPALREMNAILDEEIESLPAHYRRALVLCCLEGKSQEEAARILNRPRGTVSAWLTRGREKLRQRLLRRGIIVSTTALAAALTPDALASGGMISLIGSLIRTGGAFAAAGTIPTGLMSARSIALAEGVLRMMFMTKVKIVVAISLVVAAAAGVGTWSHTTWAGDDPLILNEKQSKEVPSREPLPKAERSRGPLPEAKINVGDHIAWGERAHGLQAGIAFRHGDQESYEVGQSVTFVVYLRNVSDKKIDLSHIEPLFDERMPDVTDAEGRHLAVATGPIHLGVVPIVRRNLEAGQRITLGYPWFRIRPLGWRGEVLGPTCCVEPGLYKVGYTSLLLRLSDGKDISLGTKQVDLDIRWRETAKVDRADKKAPIVDKPFIPGIGQPEESPLFFFPSRSIEIPFRVVVSKDQEQAPELILAVSTDQGRSWRQVDRKPSTMRSFHFDAPGDGLYWFIVGRLDNQGQVMPGDLFRDKPMIRICVDTTPPYVELHVGYVNEDKLRFTWAAKDANLLDRPVTLEWAEKKNSPWKPLVSEQLPIAGSYEVGLHDKKLSEIYVRMRVRDRVGNETHTPGSYFNLKEETHLKEHPEARRFIIRVWPTLALERLGEKIAEARKAFQICKHAGDPPSIQKLLKGTEGHADRLAKKLAELRPDLIIDDEKEAQQLKKVSEQIAKLREDIQDYLNARADDK